MSKNKIIESDREKIINKGNEKEIIEQINKEKILKLLESSGLYYAYIEELLSGVRKISSTEQCRFNIIIRKINTDYNISFIDIVLYLEETFAMFRKILSVLDACSLNVLKLELAKKHNIKIMKSDLYKLFG